MANKDQSNKTAFPFTNAVLRDLLDHQLDSIEVAHRHNLDPVAVRDAVRSEAFRRAAEALRDADLARTELIWPSMHARALHGLARIANQPTTTAAQTESARRAYTALLRAKPPLPSDTAAPPAPNQSGCRADGAAFCTPTPTKHNNPTAPIPSALATITEASDTAIQDSLRLIAEINAKRQGRPTPPGGTGVPPPLPDLNSALTTLPTPPHTPPTLAAQLVARAGAAP